MIKLGVNSVLFAGYDFETAARYIAASGYDGIEISAIAGMCEHLELDRFKEQKNKLLETVEKYELEFLAMEEASLDEKRLEKAFLAARELGIPVVNVGPGGRAGVEEDIVKTIGMLDKMSKRAEDFGVRLCVKAHVGASIYDTRTTLRAIDSIASEGFGIDMDPSHIFRVGEEPGEALAKVLHRVGHIHIRDCLQRVGSPGAPEDQACGRGSIDLYGYCSVLARGGYDGAVNLEIIGAGGLDIPRLCIIAAESYGYLNACFTKLGVRKGGRS